MFTTLRTLVAGANARAEEHVRDVFSIELIDQKIREAQAGLKAAKLSLASLIQNQRVEDRQIAALNERISDLDARAKAALADGNGERARQAAQAIADMENERARRSGTLHQLESRVERLRQSVEKGHRRIIDLKQGALQAKVMRSEQSILRNVRSSSVQTNAMSEAEELIRNVIGAKDPFEEAEILADIENRLDGSDIAERMAAEGYGAALKSTGDSVLDRLKSK